jgi:hypothetical protein
MVNVGRRTIAGLQTSSQRLIAATMALPSRSPFCAGDLFFLPFISHLKAPTITEFNSVMLVRGFAPHCVSPQSFCPPAFIIELVCVQQGSML